MKTKKIILSFAVVLFFSLIYSSCKKSDRDEDKDTTSASDNSIAENAFAGIFKSIGEFTDSTSLLRASSCATFTVDSIGTNSWPKTLTIDYGTTNCLCHDGNYRRGKIYASFTGRYRDSLTVITITLQNYYHNDNLITVGTHTITNNGHNSSGNLTYSINVQNASITTSKGTITWNSTRTREWIAGESTLFDPWDDVYLITGSADGRALNGNTFTVTINTALRVALNCQWIESGSFTITPQNVAPRFLDFGNGACDNAATVTINGSTYNITL